MANTEELNTKLISAVQSSWINRSDYRGKIKQTEHVTVFAEDGTPIEADVTFYVSWESIQQLLSLVRAKGKVTDDFSESTKS